MIKNPVLFIIFVVISTITFGPLLCQASTGAASGVLATGDRVVVSGDYVRVRSGPTLEHRILDKVNSGTEVTVLSRGDKPQKIGDSTSYWYQIKIDTQDLSGWIFGAFLTKKEPAGKDTESANDESQALPASYPSRNTSARPPKTGDGAELAPRVVLEEIGVIDEGTSEVAAGDLDRNGKPELLFLDRSKGGRPSQLNGYEKSPSGFARVYSVNMQNARAGRVEVLSTKTLDYAILTVYSAEGRGLSSRAAAGRYASAGKNSSAGRLSFAGRVREPFASLYTYDSGRGALRLASRLNTPALALGTLDGRNPFLVYLRRNRNTDSDGTLTHTIETAVVETRGGRIYLGEKYRYEKPLPVKKLALFDLDGDGRDEIIAEIGGRDMGGGIAILEMRNGSIVKRVNSGIPTCNDSLFLSLWGANVEGKPQLVVYSTDPSDSSAESSEFGFVLASLSEGTLKVDRFCPVNKMLDEVNNGRRVVRFAEMSKDAADRDFPFLIIDTEGETGRSSVKKAVL